MSADTKIQGWGVMQRYGRCGDEVETQNKCIAESVSIMSIMSIMSIRADQIRSAGQISATTGRNRPENHTVREPCDNVQLARAQRCVTRGIGRRQVPTLFSKHTNLFPSLPFTPFSAINPHTYSHTSVEVSISSELGQILSHKRLPYLTPPARLSPRFLFFDFRVSNDDDTSWLITAAQKPTSATCTFYPFHIPNQQTAAGLVPQMQNKDLAYTTQLMPRERRRSTPLKERIRSTEVLARCEVTAAHVHFL